MGRIADAIEIEQSVSPGGKCPLGITLAAMKKQEREELVQYLQLDVKHSAISKGLASLGFLSPTGKPISTGAISKHRKNECSCA